MLPVRIVATWKILPGTPTIGPADVLGVPDRAPIQPVAG